MHLEILLTSNTMDHQLYKQTLPKNKRLFFTKYGL